MTNHDKNGFNATTMVFLKNTLGALSESMLAAWPSSFPQTLAWNHIQTTLTTQ